MSKDRVPNHGHTSFDDGGKLRLSLATDAQTTSEAGGSSGGSTTTGIGTLGPLAWFNVKDYGAVGNGSTDDTTAVTATEAAIIAAGRGVLYFPSGTYFVSSGLTAVTVPCLILGDGSGSVAGAASTITTASTTANILGLSADNITVRGLRFVNTSGAETAGTAVYTTTGFGNHNRYEDLWVEGFRDGMDLLYGGEWAMDGCHITNPVRYGIYIANIDLPDGGDASITNTWVGTRSRNATAGIQMDSGGGLKLANVKINCNSAADQVTYSGVKRYTNGLAVSIATGIGTSVLEVVGSSIENVSGDAIHIATSGTGKFGAINVVGDEFGLYSNSTGYCINIAAASTGGMFTNGGIGQINVDDIVCITDGTARAAISLTKTDGTVLGPGINLNGFNARYTSSGDTNTYDATGVQSFGTPALTLSTTNAAGSATTGVRTDATVAVFDATTPANIGTAATGSAGKAARRDHVHATGAGTPTTSAIGDAASTGSGPAAAMTDHVHGREALSTATPLVESGSGAVGTGVKSSREDHVHPAAAGGAAHYLVIASSHSTPLIFGDLVQSSDGSDLIYTS